MDCIIIGDIVRSKKINLKEREELQIDIKNILEDINQKYFSMIEKKFKIVLGDQFEGILSVTWPAIYIIDEILRRVTPHRIRFGVSFGSLDNNIMDVNIEESDGPDFHNAIAAIDKAKEKDYSGFPVYISTKKVDEDIINNSISFLNHIVEKWSDTQRKYIQEMFWASNIKSVVAKRLNVNRSTVTKVLNAGNWDLYFDTLMTLSKYAREAYDYYQLGGDKTGMACEILVNEATFQFYQRNFEYAVVLYKDALSVCNKNNGALKSKILMFLGNAYRKAGFFDKAISRYNDAMELVDIQSYDVIGVLKLNMGLAYSSKKLYGEALICFREALKAFYFSSGKKETRETAKIYTNIGRVYFLQFSYAEAKKEFLYAHEIRLGLLKETDADFAYSYTGLGNVAFAEERFEEAKEYFVKALMVREHALGENDYLTAQSYSNLAETLESLGDPEHAIEYYEKALAGYQYRKYNDEVIITLKKLDDLYSQLGDVEKAILSRYEAKEIEERKSNK